MAKVKKRKINWKRIFFAFLIVFFLVICIGRLIDFIKKDRVAPVITLEGGSTIEVPLGSSYKEPGYKAIDNEDGDITKQVQIEGEIDTNTLDTYILTYSVSDKNKNKGVVKRTVKVVGENPLSMSVKDFSLNGYFTETILKETTDGKDNYTDEFIFAGDSMALYYVINKLIPGNRLWHQVSITPDTALTTPIYINHQETGLTFIEAFQKYKPAKVILTIGTNSAAYMERKFFIESYRKLIEELQKASPNTILIIQSIPPVDSKYDKDGTGINNKKINNLNYSLAELCDQMQIPFLNSAVAMKDENGACKKGYCLESDGIHPTKEGQQQLLKYAQTHMLK